MQFYFKRNATCLHYKDQLLKKVFTEISPLTLRIMKPTNKICGRTTESVNAKLGGTYNNHWALKNILREQ